MKRFPFFVVFVLLFGTILACNFGFSTANIKDAQLAKDADGNQPTTTFNQDETFYCVVELANAPDDTAVRADWVAVDVETVDSDTTLGQKELTSGGGTLTFSLDNENLWPVGDYKVDLYLNGELDRSLTFQVEGESVAQEPTATPEPEPTDTPEAETEPTDTPELAVEPTATSPPESTTGDSLGGDELPFSDDFSSDAGGWATGEFEDDYTVDNFSIEDGQYTFNITARQPAYIEKKLPGREFSDFVLTVEATPRDNAEHYSYGVSFRLGSGGVGYTFEIGNDGLYAIMLYDEGWSLLKDWSTSDAINIGETNELMVIAEGPTLTFAVNGQRLASLDDETSLEGQVGLVVDMFEADQTAVVDFDNLLIQDVDAVDLAELGETATGTESPQQADLDEVEPLPFQAEPYTHPTGTFTFAVPEGWEQLDENELAATFGDNQNTFVGAVFVDAGVVFGEADMQEFIDTFSERIITIFAEDYEILTQEAQPDDSIYLAATFDMEGERGDADFFFEQRDTVVFVLYFVTNQYDALKPTWNEVISSYSVDPAAAKDSAVPQATEAVPPLPTQPAQATVPPMPTQPPQPTEPPAADQPAFDVPEGKALFVFYNFTNVDWNIDVGPYFLEVPANTGGQEYTTGQVAIDPGTYTWKAHSPGGGYYITDANGNNTFEFTVSAGQVYEEGVR